MTENNQQLDLNDKMHFHMVLADVIFETKRGGVTSHRTQFMTQSSVDEFPFNRIHQLQNSAAFSVKEKLGEKRAEGFKVHDVLFLHMHYCGHMTREEFYGQGMTAKADVTEADKSSVLETASNDAESADKNDTQDGPTPSSDLAGVSDDETTKSDNIVPFNRS